MPVITRSQRKAIKSKQILETNQAKEQKEVKAINNERIIKTRSQRKANQAKEAETQMNELYMEEWYNWFLNYLNKTIKNINDVQVRFSKNENELEKKQMDKLRIHTELFHLINTSFEYDENSEIEIQKDVTRIIYKKSIEFYNKTVSKLNKKFINDEEMKRLINEALYEFELTQDMVFNSRNK
jgi:hypothetical protein